MHDASYTSIGHERCDLPQHFKGGKGTFRIKSDTRRNLRLAKELSAKLFLQKVDDGLRGVNGRTTADRNDDIGLNASAPVRIPEIGECSPML